MLPFSKFILVIFALSVAVTYPAQAATIDVPCNTASLVNAINIANANADADTLNLAANCEYNFASANNSSDGGNALPIITTPITINGNGAKIRRNSPPAVTFRLLYVSDTGDLTLNNVTVTDGLPNDYGGGGIRNHGTLTVVNSTLSGNLAGFGGGIYNASTGTLTVTDSTLSGNSADYGGGIYNASGGTLTVTNSSFTGNSATNSGGGIDNDGTVTVTNSTFSGNSATGYYGGGGIFNYGTLTVTDSTLSGNTADAYGGGIYNHTNGTLTVVNSSLTGNSATVTYGAGGGIFNEEGGTADVTGSVLTGNKAYYGGGLYNRGTATTANNTISGNSSTDGGGLYNYAGGEYTDGTLTVTNSIVWGNSTQLFNNATATVTFSIVQGGGTDNGNSNSDPQFINPVPYASAPTSNGDYHLRFGSPALNAGSNAALPPDNADVDGDGNIVELLPYDRDNTVRVKAGTVDRGAYEGAGSDLLANGGFETDTDQNKLPDNWSVKNPAGDKLKCNKPDKAFSYTGLCAFKFKGGIGENTKLIQNVDLNGVAFSAGDGLLLSAFFNGGSAAVKAKFIVKVGYAGGTIDKQSVTVVPNAGYAEVIVPGQVLTSGAVEQIKVMVKHKSAAGKLYIDSASLRHAPFSVTRGDILPPPSAPDGFRGRN